MINLHNAATVVKLKFRLAAFQYSTNERFGVQTPKALGYVVRDLGRGKFDAVTPGNFTPWFEIAHSWPGESARAFLRRITKFIEGNEPSFSPHLPWMYDASVVDELEDQF